MKSYSLTYSNNGRAAGMLVSFFFPSLRFRTSVERTDRSARTTQLVSLGLHKKEIDVYVLRGSRLSTVKKVNVLEITANIPLCSC